MTITLDQLKQHPQESSQAILCCYVNSTGKIQIARITNIPNWYFERVVFPGEYLLFEAPPEAELEVHQVASIGGIICDKHLCQELQVQEGNDAAPES